MICILAFCCPESAAAKFPITTATRCQRCPEQQHVQGLKSDALWMDSGCLLQARDALLSAILATRSPDVLSSLVENGTASIAARWLVEFEIEEQNTLLHTCLQVTADCP